jgi:hypothetical protein
MSLTHHNLSASDRRNAETAPQRHLRAMAKKGGNDETLREELKAEQMGFIC